jgi:hypothetical protein
MGFESFRVELRGGSVTYPQADDAVRKLPHVRPDEQSVPLPGSTFYLIADGQHTIEVELMVSPVRLSCRFTLCHPPSVDAVFLGVVRELMSRLGMEVKICDDVGPEDAHPFSVQAFAQFSAAIARYIAARRAEWIAAFGDKTMAATTNEVCERIILPRCQPGIGQPT